MRVLLHAPQRMPEPRRCLYLRLTAALLHDVIEDAGVTAAELTRRFGQDSYATHPIQLCQPFHSTLRANAILKLVIAHGVP